MSALYSISDIQANAAKASSDSKTRKPRPYCDHCRKPGHTRDTCWKIHGKPLDWKPRNKTDQTPQGNSVTSSMLNQEQLEVIQNLINKAISIKACVPSPVPPNPNSGNVAQQGSGLGDDEWMC
ncbi:uncharacterized protein [Primulina huaijiensis]|uniref:uncharacterized protein n=1 Tax=Primulina huaijiensis TaxID=1492673 RepID=UPI003CC6F146